jgi:CBS domain-containing protein
MATEVQTVTLDDLLPEAVLVLADQHVTALGVVDKGGKLVGVLSTADILTAQAETGAGPISSWEGLAVRDVMGTPPLTIEPEARLREAAQQMLYANVHRLFVVEDETLVGVISQTDVVRALATMGSRL